MKYIRCLLLNFTWGIGCLASSQEQLSSDQFVVLYCNLEKQDKGQAETTSWLTYAWIVTAESSRDEILKIVFENEKIVSINFLCRKEHGQVQSIMQYPASKKGRQGSFDKDEFIGMLQSSLSFSDFFDDFSNGVHQDCLLTSMQVREFLFEGSSYIEDIRPISSVQKRLMLIDVFNFLKKDFMGKAALHEDGKQVTYRRLSDICIDAPDMEVSLKKLENQIRPLDDEVDILDSDGKSSGQGKIIIFLGGSAASVAAIYNYHGKRGKEKNEEESHKKKSK